jgi:hypothetical protein
MAAPLNFLCKSGSSWNARIRLWFVVEGVGDPTFSLIHYDKKDF